MADTIIRREADATGWHDNLRCEGVVLPDGWAVVPESQVAVLAACGGVVTFVETTAPMADYPGVTDRRTEGRGTDYPVADQLAAGTYVPPPEPEPGPEPEPTDTEVLNTLLGVETDG